MLTGDAIWILKSPWPNGFLHLFLRTPSQPRSWYSRTWSFAFGLLLRAHVAFQFSRSTGHTTFLCKHNPKKPGRFPIPGVSCWFPGGLFSPFGHVSLLLRVPIVSLFAGKQSIANSFVRRSGGKAHRNSLWISSSRLVFVRQPEKPSTLFRCLRPPVCSQDEARVAAGQKQMGRFHW